MPANLIIFIDILRLLSQVNFTTKGTDEILVIAFSKIILLKFNFRFILATRFSFNPKIIHRNTVVSQCFLTGPSRCFPLPWQHLCSSHLRLSAIKSNYVKYWMSFDLIRFAQGLNELKKITNAAGTPAALSLSLGDRTSARTPAPGHGHPILIAPSRTRVMSGPRLSAAPHDHRTDRSCTCLSS